MYLLVLVGLVNGTSYDHYLGVVRDVVADILLLIIEMVEVRNAKEDAYIEPSLG